jgi:hypothetical protein
MRASICEASIGDDFFPPVLAMSARRSCEGATAGQVLDVQLPLAAEAVRVGSTVA